MQDEDEEENTWELETNLMVDSCTYQEKQEEFNCQVQGPMPTTPVHSRLEGFREG